MTTCWMALDDTTRGRRDDLLRPGLAATGRGAGRGGEFHAPDDWLGHVARRPARRRRARARARSRCRPAWCCIPRRLDVPREPRRTSAPTPSSRAIISHMVSTATRHGATARRTRSTRATAARASASSTRPSAPFMWSEDGHRTDWLDGFAPRPGSGARRLRRYGGRMRLTPLTRAVGSARSPATSPRPADRIPLLRQRRRRSRPGSSARWASTACTRSGSRTLGVRIAGEDVRVDMRAAAA